MASIALSSACQSSTATTAETTSPSVTNPTTPASSTTSSKPATSGSVTTTTGITSTTSTPAASTTGAPPTATYAYVPPLALPPLIEITGTACTVATDRVYSVDHVWVKTLGNNIAVLGISTTFVELIAFPNKLSLSAVGDVLKRNDVFAQIEGSKLSVDISSPVSGTILQINDFLLSFNKSVELEPLMNSTYNEGWLIVMRLSQPDELNQLISAAAYRDLIVSTKTK